MQIKISFFFLFFIAACVSQKKYNLLQQEYTLQKKELDVYKGLIYTIPKRNQEEVPPSLQNCTYFTSTNKYHLIRNYPMKRQIIDIDFDINARYNIIKNVPSFGDTTANSKIYLYMYSLCDNSFFVTHTEKRYVYNKFGEPSRYRFTYANDTFWHGYCQWTVDSINQLPTKGSTNKDLSINQGRFKYGYDVYLQCTDCVSAFKNEKGECLCSR